jgi:murein DD-endopeptidase MepM/ murein hydrolase activator NlpD
MPYRVGLTSTDQKGRIPALRVGADGTKSMMDRTTRVKQDYKALSAPQRPKSSPMHWFVFGAALPILSLSFALHMGDAAAMRQMIEPGVFESTTSLDPEESSGILHLTEQTLATILGEDWRNHSVELFADESTLALELPPSPFGDPDWISLTVTRGDSLSQIFERFELPRQDLQAITEIASYKRYLRNLQPGDEFRIKVGDGGRIAELVHDVDPLSTLHLVREGERFQSELITHPVERRQVTTQGVIRSSLFQAGKDAGLSQQAILQLADIFAYEIDFALDLREGDELKVVYEASYRDGEEVLAGPILAAEFSNQGKTYQAVRYAGKEGKARYYSPAGKSLRKAFLRTPVDFSRISSGFSLGRRHPILNTIRAHKGVDYAAPRGTAIKAAGDGKIVFKGTKSGYGNVIEIAHNQHHTTLYAHMNGFAKGLATGARVAAGQVIGYVGSTGLATGPHLHYELRVDGVHRDPLKVNTPLADNLDGRELQAFKAQAAPLLTALQTTDTSTRLAQNKPVSSAN